MFEIKLTVQGNTSLKRQLARMDLEETLRAEFGFAIKDVSQWGSEHSPKVNADLISVLFEHRKPQQIRQYITTKRYEVISMQNLVSSAFFPINRVEKRTGVKRRKAE